MRLPCSPRVFATRVIDRSLGGRVLPAAWTGRGAVGPEGERTRTGMRAGGRPRHNVKGATGLPGAKHTALCPEQAALRVSVWGGGSRLS